MKKYLQLIRIKHWVKNILIFIPMLSAKVITYPNVLSEIIAFLAFSFASSAVYIFNDIKDIEKDKLHPRKKNRPLPSGKISKKTAAIIAIILLCFSLAICIYLSNSIFNSSLYLLVAYIAINILYSLGLKNIAIIDIIILASGFILRVYFGASILNIEVSSWLFLTIMSAALFLGIGKRKKELIKNKNARKVLEQYNEAFLDKFQYISLSLMLVFYSLWTLEQTTKYLVFTIPLLIVIFMKYCLIIEGNDEGDPTTILYKDKALLTLCILYGIIMVVLFSI